MLASIDTYPNQIHIYDSQNCQERDREREREREGEKEGDKIREVER